MIEAEVPRQPACTAAKAPVFGSPIKTGTQSAVLTASRILGVLLTRASQYSSSPSTSAFGFASASLCTTRTSALCVCQQPVTCEEFEKAAAVLVNIFGGVFVEAGETQRVARHRTNAAQPGGEGIRE